MHPYLEGKQRIFRPQNPFFFSSATRVGTLANSGLRAGKKEGRERKKNPSCFLFSPLRACSQARLTPFSSSANHFLGETFVIPGIDEFESIQTWRRCPYSWYLQKRKAGLRLPNFAQLVVSYKKINVYLISQGSPGKPIRLIPSTHKINVPKEARWIAPEHGQQSLEFNF